MSLDLCLEALLEAGFLLRGEEIIRLSTGKAVAATPGRRGYCLLSVGVKPTQRMVLYHRVKFFLAYGWLPACVDHRDGDPSNNSLLNLRAATKRQNAHNSKPRSRANGLPQGVVLRVTSAGRRRFYASSRDRAGSLQALGGFDSTAEASAAVQAFKLKHYGEFYRKAD